MTSRRLDIAAERLPRWAGGFRERHGEPEAVSDSLEQIEFASPDGTRVVLHARFPADFDPSQQDGGMPDWATAVQLVVQNAAASRALAVLLIRRNGYAVAQMTAGRVTASKVGSAYVQGRTAAGGWSQQRFARRRDQQVQGLLGSAAEVASRILIPVQAQFLVTGGDRDLIERLLAHSRLASLASLPRGPHLEVGDPRNDDVIALPERIRRVRLRLDQP